MKKGFTLIELLIVVLIIAILAAIAVPNFLEFQTRAKVSRVKADQRSLATAIEAYYVDNNQYPAMANGNAAANAGAPDPGAGGICTFTLRTPYPGGTPTALSTLTTPIGYITTYPPDPFATTKGTTFGYRQFEFTWLLISYGPDRDEIPDMGDHDNSTCTVSDPLGADGNDTNFETCFDLNLGQPSPEYLTGVGSGGSSLHYDPSNGTTSPGDIVRVKQ
ncbi:prepilin-type N-terminal cleavage/methylation domain-containing protein [Candidatus Sumerlaeota bacterium]|nr:prepilin-type N-terminal cleavage/methylation domain-containing protein [Candidatus Sumerlaeota bacterium]